MLIMRDHVAKILRTNGFARYTAIVGVALRGTIGPPLAVAHFPKTVVIEKKKKYYIKILYCYSSLTYNYLWVQC